MSSKLDHMFPDRELTEQEIRDYHAGQLSPDEMNRVERIAASNPMSAEALEGFTSARHADVLADIKKTVSRRSGITLGPWVKFAALGGVAIIVAFVAFQNQQANQEEPQPIAENKEIPTETLNAQEPEEQQVTVVKQRSTDSSVSVVVSIPNELRDLEEPFMHYQEIPDPEALDPITFELLADYHIDDEPTLVTPAAGARIYHIRDYKLVDYRGLREESFPVLKKDLTGLPAKYADEGERADGLPQITGVPYVDYLEGAMVEFSQEDFITATKHFDKILKVYPDDANALFYGAMSRYYSGKEKRAISLFERALLGEHNTFHDEAEFYMARSLRESGKSDEAKVVFERIFAGDGFYATQAERYLD
jgi:TolA-binding protein